MVFGTRGSHLSQTKGPDSLCFFFVNKFQAACIFSIDSDHAVDFSIYFLKSIYYTIQKPKNNNFKLKFFKTWLDQKKK
jgi:hypothetical protein